MTAIDNCIIKQVVHPQAYELRQARIDNALVTGKPLTERPFYYENITSGEQYHGLYGCIAYPTEVSEKDIGRPGYVAVVAVLKNSKPVEQSGFLLMEEAESKDVFTLLNYILEMREKYGYGLHPDLLSSWWGDSDRFISTLGRFNESIKGKEIMIAPPVDFQDVMAFDNYNHSMRSVITPGRVRFGFGNNRILMNRLQGLYKRDDPAVLAVGGLIHTLLLSCEWMDQHQSNVAVVEENNV
jgi:hypothetical protein